MKTGNGNLGTVNGYVAMADKLAGIKDPMTDRALALAANGFKHMQSDETGKIGYTNPGAGSEWMTGVGALSLMMTGHIDSPEVAHALANEVDRENAKRRAIEKGMFEAAREQVEGHHRVRPYAERDRAVVWTGAGLQL